MSPGGGREEPVQEVLETLGYQFTLTMIAVLSVFVIVQTMVNLRLKQTKIIEAAADPS